MRYFEQGGYVVIKTIATTVENRLGAKGKQLKDIIFHPQIGKN